MKYYVVHNTDKKREKKASDQLANMGYDTYCPMVLKDRRLTAHATFEKSIEALFSSYFFIRYDGDWMKLSSDLGKYNHVLRGPDGSPKPIADEIIDLLKSRENDQGVHEAANWKYRQGDKVVPKDGPFEGREAIISAIKGRDLKLLFQVMNRSVEVPFNDSDIEPL